MKCVFYFFFILLKNSFLLFVVVHVLNPTQFICSLTVMSANGEDIHIHLFPGQNSNDFFFPFRFRIHKLKCVNRILIYIFFAGVIHSWVVS